jgi:hypothetical protein
MPQCPDVCRARAFVRNGRRKPVRGALVIERQSGLRSGSVSRFGRSARTACCSRGKRRLDLRSAVALVLPSLRSVSHGRSVHCMSRQSLSCLRLLLQKKPSGGEIGGLAAMEHVGLGGCRDIGHKHSAKHYDTQHECSPSEIRRGHSPARTKAMRLMMDGAHVR